MSQTIDTTELRLREREMKLKEDELAHRREMDARSSRFQLSPWTTALIALLTTGATASVSGLWSQFGDSAKAERDLALREREQQFQIVMKATENRTPAEAINNLLFFVDIGYLADSAGKIRQKAAAGCYPVFTSTSGKVTNPIAERVAQGSPGVRCPPFSIQNHVLYRANGEPVSVVPTPAVTRLEQPRFLILHSTGTATAREAITFLADTGAGAGSHLIVDRNGDVTQMAPFDFATHGVGRSSWNGMTSLNKYSLSIEMVNRGQLRRRGNRWVDFGGREVPAADVVVRRADGPGATRGWHAYSEPQVRRVIELVRVLQAGYPTLAEILGHSQVSPGRDQFDPGPALHLERIRREAATSSR
jgi:N-acetylmuramoyl-L-alanine amidase